jgi:hypothetical protein
MMNVQWFVANQTNLMFTVMIVAIAVGFLYLTWKQYQQPAQDKFCLPEGCAEARDHVVGLLNLMAILLVGLAVWLALTGVWQRELWRVGITGSLVAVAAFGVTLNVQNMLHKIFFYPRPTNASRAR